MRSKSLSPALKKRARELGIAGIGHVGDDERYGWEVSAGIGWGLRGIGGATTTIFPKHQEPLPSWVIQSTSSRNGSEWRLGPRGPKPRSENARREWFKSYTSVGAPWEKLVTFLTHVTKEEVAELADFGELEHWPELIARIMARGGPKVSRNAPAPTPADPPKRASRTKPKARKQTRQVERDPKPRRRIPPSTVATRAHVSHGIRADVHTFACQVCGEKFRAPRSDALFCSNACRQKNYRMGKEKPRA
jgi:hypothetical protein